MQSILFLGAKLLSSINVVCLTVTHSHCQERFFCLKVVLVNDRIIVVLSGKLSFFFYIRIAMRLFIVHLIFNIFSCLSYRQFHLLLLGNCFAPMDNQSLLRQHFKKVCSRSAVPGCRNIFLVDKGLVLAKKYTNNQNVTYLQAVPIVCVLPDPVWPYANTVTLKPERIR